MMMDAVKCNDYPLYPLVPPTHDKDGDEEGEASYTCWWTLKQSRKTRATSCAPIMISEVPDFDNCEVENYVLLTDISYQISTIVKKVIITPWLQEQMAPSPSSLLLLLLLKPRNLQRPNKTLLLHRLLWTQRINLMKRLGCLFKSDDVDRQVIHSYWQIPPPQPALDTNDQLDDRDLASPPGPILNDSFEDKTGLAPPPG